MSFQTISFWAVLASACATPWDVRPSLICFGLYAMLSIERAYSNKPQEPAESKLGLGAQWLKSLNDTIQGFDKELKELRSELNGLNVGRGLGKK